MRALPFVGVAVLLGAAVACHGSKSPTYTLYRSEAALGDTARIHVATFDAVDDEVAYNHESCERTRELYQVQPRNLAKFWCETGRFTVKK